MKFKLRKVDPPPDNSSKETRLELNWLKNYNDGKVDEDVVKRGDNIKDVYREYCEDNKLKYPKEYVKELIKDSGKLIYKLKYKFNRPRPKQVDYLEIDLPTTTLESNAHTILSKWSFHTRNFIGKVLSKMYPNHEKKLMKLGKMISNSRLMGTLSK